MFARKILSTRLRFTARLKRRNARSIDSLSLTLMPTDKAYSQLFSLERYGQFAIIIKNDRPRHP